MNAVALDVGVLYEEHAPGIRRYLIRQLRGDPGGIADDLTSDVFVRAIRSADSYVDRGLHPRSWLYRIARNLFIDHTRAHRPTEELSELTDRSGIDAGASHQDTALDVRSVLDRLRPDHRAVLEARFIQGEDTRQTATSLGRSEDAVKKLQARALVNARRVMETPMHVQTVNRPDAAPDARAPVQSITLPSIPEVHAWNISTREMVTALEREEADALREYNQAKARLHTARQSAEAARRVRDILRIGGEVPKAPIAITAPVSRTGGRWARLYDACVACHRDTIKHASRGLCQTCYAKAQRNHGQPTCDV